MRGVKTVKESIFEYSVVNGNYVVVNGYKWKKGKLTFKKSSDGYFLHTINVPERIENLPVLVVEPLRLDIKTEGLNRYTHNGSALVQLNLPAHTVFNGVGYSQTDIGRLIPHHKVKFYSRTDEKLIVNGGKDGVFAAKPYSKGKCVLIFVYTDKSTLNIPNKICGKKVLAVDKDSIFGCPNVKELSFCDGIRRIETNSFLRFPSLQNVYLGKNLDIISGECFLPYKTKRGKFYAGIRKVTVYYHSDCYKPLLPFNTENTGGNVKLIPYEEAEIHLEGDVLAECVVSGKEVIVSEGISAIKDGAFSGNSFVKTVYLPESVLSIGAYAFKNCFNLQRIILPKNLKTIGVGAFYNCINLKTLSIPSGVSLIEKSTCQNCKSLVRVTLPKGLKQIAEHAFSYTGLKNLNIPSGVKCIKHQAFFKCLDLQKIKMPKGVENVDVFAFSDTPLYHQYSS